jgi:hypothetical protein
MLGLGWAYDLLHATSPIARRNARVATAACRKFSLEKMD